MAISLFHLENYNLEKGQYFENLGKNLTFTLTLFTYKTAKTFIQYFQLIIYLR